MEDRQLLQRFVKDNSQEAFALLTARYLNLVYAVCRREMDDADAAEDVTQAVFLILARKAPSLGRNVVLSGWLFQTARFAAKNARLTAQRRAAYEQKAAEALMEQQMGTEETEWTEIEPLLNQSLAALKPGDRDCLLLRFFQGQSFAEVGAALGLSEEAARKRVTRSLEKMRQFFTKNGVIVPALALPVLLTAHAAKAAPITCQDGVTALINSAYAGHTTTAATGSHAYQLSEGTLKAMKIVRLKLAAGITVIALSVGTYAVAKEISVSHSKPGHVLQQVPGQTLTAAQIAGRCRAAYAALSTYQANVAVVTQSRVPTETVPVQYQTTATIKFAPSGKLRVSGTDLSHNPYAYISDGIETEETTASIKGAWRRDKDTEMAVASTAGISSGAATIIPALLLGTGIGKPLVLGKLPDAEVREDNVDGKLCYVLIAHSESPTRIETQIGWIDEKTLLLRRIVDDSENQPRTFIISGKTINIPAMKSHDEQNITDQRINQPIPNSTFALPAVQ